MQKLSEQAQKNKTAYNVRYNKTHLVQKRIALNDNNEEDMKILSWLNQQQNLSRYLKDLILTDMIRSGS